MLLRIHKHNFILKHSPYCCCHLQWNICTPCICIFHEINVFCLISLYNQVFSQSPNSPVRPPCHYRNPRSTPSSPNIKLLHSCLHIFQTIIPHFITKKLKISPKHSLRWIIVVAESKNQDPIINTINLFIFFVIWYYTNNPSNSLTMSTKWTNILLSLITIWWLTYICPKPLAKKQEKLEYKENVSRTKQIHSDSIIFFV